MPTAQELQSLWYRALSEPLGVRVVCDPVRLKPLLYYARRAAADPSIAHLQVRASPVAPSTELWIVNPRSPPDDGN